MKGPFPGQVLVAIGLDSNNGIHLLDYALVELKVRVHGAGRAKSDLLLNNICEVFNGKIVEGRDKPVVTLLEYIREYCMKRIVNVQSIIDKSPGPLTPTATRIMKSIKKEAHLMKVQWNGGIKYQVSSLLEYSFEIPKGTTLRILGKSLLFVDYIEGKILLQCRPKKKRKRSKHEDEPFVKDGKLSKKGIEEPLYVNPMETLDTIRQHAKGKVESGNNTEASSSASGQAQQAKPIISQDGLVGSGVGDVIGLSAVGGQEGSGGAGVGVGSQVPVTKIRNVDGREIGDGIPTEPSAAGGASEWSILYYGFLPTFPSISYFMKLGRLNNNNKTEVMKDGVSQEHMCEEEVPFNNNKGKLSGDLVEMPSEVVK
ncbi:hypothetical protein Tco_0237579 [Tanacetum coccineum]